jgi:DNA-directed RNA polymerase subunit M/transcription elongation factor TFIIS
MNVIYTYILSNMKIRFCQKCDNMLYIHSTDALTNLKYYCKNCDYTEIDEKPSGCIYENVYNTNYLTYDIITNKYTRNDPTLPRIKKMKCINKDCVSNFGHKNVLLLTDITIQEGKMDKFEDALSKILEGVEYERINIDTDNILLKFKDISPLQSVKNEIEKVHKYVEFHKELDSLIIFIKYDPENLKYVYVCDYCNTSWKNK